MRAAFRAVLAAALAWSVGAAAVVALGVVGISLIGATMSDRAAPSRGPTSGKPAGPDRQASGAISSPTTLGPHSPTAAKRLIISPGGTVRARCSGEAASLASVSPAPGYRAIAVNGGPAPEATVTFQSGQDRVEVVVRCLSGVPRVTLHGAGEDDDDQDD